MNCEQCDRYLLDLAEGDVPVPAEVREHVASCSDCDAKVRVLREGLQISAGLPIEEPPPELDAPILDAARAHVEAQSESDGRGWSWGMPQLAAAAVALLAVGIGFWSTDNPWTPAAQRAPAVEPTSADEPAPAVQDVAREGIGGDYKGELFEVVEAESEVSSTQTEPTPRELQQVRVKSPTAGRIAKKAGAKRKGSRARGGGHEGATSGLGYRGSGEAAAAKQQADVAMDDSAADAFAEEAFGAAGGAVTTGAPKRQRREVSAKERAPAAAKPPPTKENKRAPAKGADGETRKDSQYLERCKSAVPEYERFLAKASPKDEGLPQVELELGRCYRALGKTAKAKTMLRQAAAHEKTRRAAIRELDAIESAETR